MDSPSCLQFPKLRRFFQRHWRRALTVRERLRFSEETFHLILAGGVGVVGGVVNLLFFHANQAVKLWIFGRGGDVVEAAEALPIWARLVVPVGGGLVAGLVLYWGLRLAGPQRANNLLEVIIAGNGRLPFRSAVIKALSSLISISSGASIGREGAITHLSATLASKWGQLAGWHPYRLRLLVGCGAASGIAAAYNAPISGAVFAALIVLGNFSMNMFAPLVFASVVAAMVSRSFFGLEPWYSVPQFPVTRLVQLPWFLLLGMLAGTMGAAFLKALSIGETLFKRMAVPVYVRLMIGGIIVGVLALRFPEVWGNGYVATNRILEDHYPGGIGGLMFLAGLFLAKLLATAATVGSGAVGGVFTPTLFLGAGLGAVFGMGLHLLKGGQDLPLTAFALVGMASMLAATSRSPLLAMIMIFEISLDYSLMPPLMLACVVATLVAGRLHPASIYTEPLRRKGLTVCQEAITSEAATERTVADLMRSAVPAIRETATLQQIADRFLSSSHNFVPVVDDEHRLLGQVALQDLKEHLQSGREILGIIAYDVMRPAPVCVTPSQRLVDVLPVVLASEQRNIPVVDTLKDNHLVGALVRAEVLGIFSEVIAARSRSGE